MRWKSKISSSLKFGEILMNKKAQGEEWLKKGILALVILVLLILLYRGVFTDIRQVGEDTKCISSVNFASMGKGEIICPTNDVFIDESDQDKIVDAILFEQYKCGMKFHFHDGTADKNPFKYWNTDSICTICTNVSLSTKAEAVFKSLKPGDIDLRSMEAYVPKSSPKKTYYEFFNGGIPTEEDKKKIKKAKESQDVYGDSVEEFQIVYLVYQATQNEAFWKGLGFGSAAAGGTYLVGAILLPGVKVRAAGFLLFATLGAAVGGTTGSLVGEKFEASTLQDVGVLFIPKDIEEFKKLKCQTLGNEPFDNPFEKEVEETVAEIVKKEVKNDEQES